jgi:7-cyano-7-deazaguanine reductase
LDWIRFEDKPMTDYSKASDATVEIPEGVTVATFPAREHTPLIELEYPEFQSLCPISERHDQGVVTIRYRPRDKILEGKSLRDYLMMWRNKRNWQEYITEEIADLLCKSCEPEWLSVTISWTARGGILAKTTTERGKQDRP